MGRYKVEKFISTYKGNKKIFLGDTDSYTVVQNGYSEDNLILKIKIAVLLYDVVFIPAAYMWQSEQMKEVMYKIQSLILTENVLPIIRKSKETRDVKDYFEKRASETKNLKNMEVYKIPGLATEIADADDKKDMLFLYNLKCCLHLEEKSVKEEFINLWKHDLKNNSDTNSIFMLLYRSNVDIRYYNKILRKLENEVDYVNFSRSTLINYVLKLDISEPVKQFMQDRISWLYLNANAKASQSDFYISKSVNNMLIYKANLSMYLELLRNFGITELMIRSLSMEELLRIKNSAEYLNFIVNYNELVNDLYYEQLNLVEKTHNRINRILAKEDIKRKIWSKLPGVFGLSSTIFIGLVVNYFSGSDINNTVLEVAGGLAGYTYIIKKLEKINKSISSASFIDFKEYIIKEKYKSKMQKNINGVLL